MKYQQKEQQLSTGHSEVNWNMDAGKGKNAWKKCSFVKDLLKS